MERKQFTFYRSFWDAVKDKNKKVQLEYLVAIIEYSLDGTEPTGLSDVADMAFTLTRPTLDASRKKAENGRQGGLKRPENRKLAYPNGKSKTEANRKQNGSKVEVEVEGEVEVEVEGEVEVEVEVEGEVEKEKESYFSFSAGAEPPPHDPLLRVRTKENDFFKIYPATLARLEAAYPSVDVVSELRKLIHWCDEHPEKRKGAREMLPFISRWMERAAAPAPADDSAEIAYMRRLIDNQRRADKEDEGC